MQKLYRTCSKDYHSDDEEEVPEEAHTGPASAGGPEDPAASSGIDGEAAVDADAQSDDELGEDGPHQGITKLAEGSRAFKLTFSKIMKKKLPNEPLVPVLSAHKSLVAEKLAEGATEHKAKVETKRLKLLAQEKGHVIPASFLDVKEKHLVSVATKGVLSHKLSYARHDAQEKSKPMDDLFLKFEEAQHTMEEAELVLNALLIANENVKYERDCCKEANEELHKEKVALTEEVQRLEASNLSEARHFKSLQEQIQMSLTNILNIISTFQGTSQRANLVVGAELSANCSDIVSLGYEVLQCIRTSRS